MLRVIWLLLLVLSSLRAQHTEAFSNEDPSLYHNIDVISGQCVMGFEDMTVAGPSPFSLFRTYNSQGALDRYVKSSPMKKLKKDNLWQLDGGWDVLAYTHMILVRQKNCRYSHEPARFKYGNFEYIHEFTCFTAYVPEKNGQLVTYDCYKEHSLKKFSLKPTQYRSRLTAEGTGTQDICQNILNIYTNKVVIKLPDGGKRVYEGSFGKFTEIAYCRLVLEVLPNKHRVVYSYDNKNRLKTIELKNPQGNITYTTLTFDEKKFKKKGKLRVQSSDGQTVEYLFANIDEWHYLQGSQATGKPNQTFAYYKDRTAIGARVHTATLANRERMGIVYYEPSAKEEQKWSKHPKKQPYHIDKVHQLYLPDPNTGQLELFATFSYEKNKTTVQDAKGVVTHYYHGKDNLTKVEYFDSQGHLVGTTSYQWEQGSERHHLIEKTLYAPDGFAILSKHYSYDANENIIQERVTDHITHQTQDTTYTYDPKTGFLLSVQEQSGLSIHYTYHDKSNQPISKFTRFGGNLIAREFYRYDWNHLLVQIICDDGQGTFLKDLTGVTQRHITRHVIDDPTGRIRETTQSALECHTGEEILIQRQTYAYTARGQIQSLTHYDAQNKERYTLHYSYDEAGHLIASTTPQGYTNHATYDSENRLIAQKHKGTAPVYFTYDYCDRVKTLTQGEETTSMRYNLFGELVEQINPLGHKTLQEYDSFSRSVATILTPTLDENKRPYTPKLSCGYDLQGNLTHTTDPKGQITLTFYNARQLPTATLYPDQTATVTRYNSDTTIDTMVDEEGNTTHIVYDHYKRPLQKLFKDAHANILAKESWTYNTCHLLSHTEPTGLTTTYRYDPMGRLIQENQEERITTYEYDALGQLEKITKGETLHIQKHNEEQQILEEWTEDIYGTRENHMCYAYDQEGRKSIAYRYTAHGLQQDCFAYDAKGRLVRHIDPLGAQTTWIYSIVQDPLRNKVEQTIEIDPLGNRSLTTKDSQGRISRLEKQDKDHNTRALEEFYYDRAGNLAKRTTTLFEDTETKTTHTTNWTYTPRGQILTENEEDHKITQYTYDKKQRLSTKTLPDGKTIQYTYDPLGRLLSLKGPDLHYTYIYANTPQPTQATDQIRNLTWHHTYNHFGELIEERSPDGATMHWNYDIQGRCTHLQLPDQSAIGYTYDPLHMRAVHRYDKDHTLLYTHTYTHFDPTGHVQQENLIHNLGTLHTERDPLERPTTLTSPHYTHTIAYDAKSRIIHQQNSLFNPKAYTYDPLDQLTQEGDKTHRFDSLGNPQNSSINSLNQLVQHNDSHYDYNDNGEQIATTTPSKTIHYRYDLLGRLTSIRDPYQNTDYTYDPFHRLYAKETTLYGYFYNTTETTRYLHDQELEIGTLNPDHTIKELKVLGLGLLGDIGAAIAIELDQVYAPLHDIQGNIIALISADNTLCELWEPDAFGTTLTTTTKNPWRFQSKRQEHHLVHFGARFYDPTTGRWLTPDPAGSIDSTNLYLFVRNTPLNRLDLFGLLSCQTNMESQFGYQNIYPCRYQGDNGSFDGYVYTNRMHTLTFTPEEKQKGTFNLFDKLDQLCPSAGSCISTILHLNGIQTELENDFLPNFASLITNTTKDTTIIGMHSEKLSLFNDICTGFNEKIGMSTIAAKRYCELLSELLLVMCKINPELLLLEVPHSRGGATVYCANQQLAPEIYALGQTHRLGIGVAPLMPLSKQMFMDAVNFYSEDDPVTKRFGQKYMEKKEEYDIQLLPSQIGINPIFYELSKRLIGTVPTNVADVARRLPEHSFRGKTCQEGLKRSIKNYENKHGFYKNNR